MTDKNYLDAINEKKRAKKPAEPPAQAASDASFTIARKVPSVSLATRIPVATDEALSQWCQRHAMTRTAAITKAIELLTRG